jgi:hypothetical protein
MQKMPWKHEKERVINRSRTSIISQIIPTIQVALKMTNRVKGKKKGFIEEPKKERILKVKNPKKLEEVCFSLTWNLFKESEVGVLKRV